MHIVKQISLTTGPTLLCEVSLNFYLCITLPVVHRLLVSVTTAASLMYRQMLNFSLSKPTQLPFPTVLQVTIIFLPMKRSLFG